MTRRFNELLLGFDAREMWLEFSEDWSEERQRLFLLRRDIIKPLSAHTVTWRSVFDAQTSPCNHQSGAIRSWACGTI